MKKTPTIHEHRVTFQVWCEECQTQIGGIHGTGRGYVESELDRLMEKHREVCSFEWSERR